MTNTPETSVKFDTSHQVIEDIVYSLSNHIFSYAEHVPLNRYLTQWNDSGRKNGFSNNVELFNLEARSGAAGLLLGSYTAAISSPGVYAMITPSSCLSLMNPLISNIGLFYGTSKPLVLHVAALDYVEQAYRTDNTSVLDFAYLNNFTVFTSQSNVEAAYMALASTIAAKKSPTVHVYEPDAIVSALAPSLPTLDTEAVIDCFNSFESDQDPIQNAANALTHINNHFSTKYKPVEYEGSSSASKVIVTFGKTETTAARNLLAANQDLGLLSIRTFPFSVEELHRSLPSACRKVVVLSQVRSTSVSSPSFYYSSILASLLDTENLQFSVEEQRYAVKESLTTNSLYKALSDSLGLNYASPVASKVEKSISFWELDSSEYYIPYLVSAHRTDKSRSVAFRTLYDNLVLAGVRFTTIQLSGRDVLLTDVAHDLEADVSVVANDKIPSYYRVLANAAKQSICLLQTSISHEEITSKLPYEFLTDITNKEIKLVLVNPKKFAINGSNLPILSAYVQLFEPGLGATEAFNVLCKEKGFNETIRNSAIDSLKEALSFVNVEEASLKEREPSDRQLPSVAAETSFGSNPIKSLEEDVAPRTSSWETVAQQMMFPEAYKKEDVLRPDVSEQVYTVRVKSNKRLTPASYSRNIFHIEFDLGNSGLTYDIGEALGVYGVNNKKHVLDFIEEYGLDADELIQVPSTFYKGHWETRTVYQALSQNIDIFGKPTKKFYEQLAQYETDEKERSDLETLVSPVGAPDFKRRVEVDMLTYADVLKEFKHAKLSASELAVVVPLIKRREYSISSSQRKHKDSVHLLIVVVDWKDGMGRDRYGQCSHYLSRLRAGDPVTVAVKSSVMKLPKSPEKPIVMAGLGTGLAPFRAFLQFKEWQRLQGIPSGDIVLYLGSRTQREEYLYGEDWEAYHAANLLTFIGQAFSRDQPYKIYIQDVMRSSKELLKKTLIDEGGSFYLCGPTWPLPEITGVLEEVIQSSASEPIDARRVIEQWKEERRFVIEVY
ncbi:sulfite reductase NADPH flavoprotein subunit [Schizosaccharomyces cryophilus OY26]|uniref:assimilatory sulfite reductase (NADPH) n=1 Tax=Schizosaccharomyces cryophilus (strain OY26 / ATCC MYA-4695 / CBS 11777 / NBRC 106824 / NRRL Y48691) TaxID=653667 RepID=S9XBZ9_SCHCR|nr:sulfite reductase NADPH flavoprotein subunit [Schizosaccharomyces cryophilus OY26]EPY51321.1 sulfite reductase NADPH flavoprotein subunit [Schizosaccharomyces cryophilus OY26]